jgi:sterol desaturase/sphingolipid hydroxylase (fatty acid hydroxylase superfamily)/uncharacterized membrane protein YhhN
MSPSQIIVIATPVFFLFIGIEFAWGWYRGRNTYRLNDAINSISVGMLSQITAIFTRLFRIGIYTAIYSSVALYPYQAFWTTWYGWLLALVFYDLCYYWLHRLGHESAILWAAHAVHHQSQDYNLSTALRQTSSGALLGWLFYLPMAVAGVPPLVFGVVALIDLLYQFWVHTEHVPKLGWFDRVFCSPSNHRVHHAVNDGYLDRNYGGLLILWDRLFGSFQEEHEKCVYGTRSALNSWDPLWANLQVYRELAHDAWHAQRWGDKIRVWFKPPGWRPADVAARFPKPAFELSGFEIYHPPLTRTLQWFGALQFVLLIAATMVFLWFADTLAISQSAIWLVALSAALWALGACLQGRLGVMAVLTVEAAAAATATSAAGLSDLHMLFKPLAMLLLIALVFSQAQARGGIRRFDAGLLGALLASLAGDVLLMFPGMFIPGLLCFLTAHLFFIALFRQGVAWFPNQRALLGTLAIGLVMYAVLWSHLGPVLRVAVAAYVCVIALMAAQAIGRASVLRDRAALCVAVGSGLFMMSDSLLAFGRFVQPLPLGPLWVLGSYYAAQMLIASNAQAAQALNSSSLDLGGTTPR